MNRRQLLGLTAAVCLAGHRAVWAQTLRYDMPDRFARPDAGTDEGGLWAMMDRQERNLRRSPFLVRDPNLREYIQDIACRLSGDHCPDLRVHILRNPLFNASMAPNGMIQVWSGLLLRMENEAQLAAVIAHEIGHYLQRHALERLRDAKTKSVFGQFLSAFGLAGAVGQLGVASSMLTYGRDQEREADRIGAILMQRAGYDIAEAAHVWEFLRAEQAQREGKTNPMLSTHPSSPERQEAFAIYAAEITGGEKGEAAYRAATERFLPEWLDDELKRAQYEESIVLLTRLIGPEPRSAQLFYSRGEAYRLRADGGDLDSARSDYSVALELADAPAAAHRGLGLVARQQGDVAVARANLIRYLELAPDAADAALIKDYLKETKP